MHDASPIICELHPGPLPLSNPMPRVDAQTCGAEAIFIGRSRAESHPEHGGLLALEYEAHEQLALSALRKIAEEIRTEFSAELVSLRHATGRVGVGEPSVEVIVLTGHRREAFTACQAGIDRIKREVPIWKRECWEHGSTWSSAAVTMPTDAGDGS